MNTESTGKNMMRGLEVSVMAIGVMLDNARAKLLIPRALYMMRNY